MYNSFGVKTIKSIKDFTYLDLKELLNSIPDEELVGHLVQVAYLGGDAYGSAEEEWDDVDVAELNENEEGVKFISLFCSKLRK